MQYEDLNAMGQLLGDKLCAMVADKVEVLEKKLIVSINRTHKATLIQKTKDRLYAYPQLLCNIKKYRLDIKDIQRENFGKSKSIVVMQPKSGEDFSLEDKRAARIRMIEQKIDRDEEEIEEIERALQTIKEEFYYPAIEMYFFKGMKRSEIGDYLNCDGSTVSRQINKLIERMNVALYGADAVN